MPDAVTIQRDYYTATANTYEAAHGTDEEVARLGLPLLSMLINHLSVSSVLDVGSGTGRALRVLQQSHPSLSLYGIEPVQALRDQTAIPILAGEGEHLPFSDGTIGLVCEISTLHHVADPNRIVREMTRVARRAVVIIDANRFGQGSTLARLVKLGLYKAHLWPLVVYSRTRGKGYFISEGDGLFYSYSVYDSLNTLADWADRVLIFGLSGHASWFHPLLTSPQILMCGIRD